MKSDNIELFTAYLESNLSSLERKAFESRLSQDPDLANAFNDFQDIYQVLENQFSEERSAVLDSIQKADSEYKNTTGSESSKRIFPFKPWQMGVAASVLFIIGLFVFNNSSNPNYSDFATHSKIVLTVRSQSDSLAKKAETTFNTGNYKEAISYFDALLKESPNNAEFEFYKAIAHLENNDFDIAENLFKSLSKGNSVYAYNAIYWHALSKLKQKKYNDAKSILQTIPQGVVEYDKAQELLSEL